MSGHGPWPAWLPAGPGGPWETAGPDGTVWRLWHVGNPVPGDPHPAGYRLAPRDGRGSPEYIADTGLYDVLDTASARIEDGG